MAKRRNRRIKNRPKTLKERYNNAKTLLGKPLAPIGLSLAILVGSTIAYTNYIANNRVTIAKAVDSLENDYDGVVPMYDSNGNCIGTIKDGSYIIIDGKEDADGEVNAVAITEDGESLSGQINVKYFEELEKISKKEIEEYNTIYTVSPEVGVNVRSSAEISDDNKIGTIEQGEQVLGATKLLPEGNKFMWVPVIYINEDGLTKGYIRSDLLEKQSSIDIEQPESNKETKIKMVVDTSKDSSVPLKLRSSQTKNEDNIICEIPDGSTVYALSKKTEENESIDWRRVEYTDEGGNIHVGWVADGFLEEYNEVTKIVDTSGSGKNTLNVRKTPGTDSEKIAEIENGTKLKISEAEIESRQKFGNHEWVKVTLTDGTEGYVAYEYLKDETEKEYTAPSSEIIEEVINNKSLAPNGRVVGIDVANNVSASQLKKLLTTKGGAIKASTSRIVGWNGDGTAIYKDADTSDITGKINYVYIKLGATGYGEDFSILPNDNYIKQAEVCEELGIPYGFYYYSTSKTKDEAKKESKFIQEAIESLEDRDYNLLPIALDYELSSGTSDRQYGLDLTDVKAYLANLVEPKFGKTIVYGGVRSISPTSSERILNLEEYNKKLATGDCNVWLAMPRTSENYAISSKTQKAYNSIKEQSSVSVEQTLLDATVKDTDIDIDVMDESTYEQMINNQYEELKDISKEQEREN